MCCCPRYRYCYCSRLLALSQLQFDRAWNQLLGAAAHVMAMESTGQFFSRFQRDLEGWVFTAFTECKLLYFCQALVQSACDQSDMCQPSPFSMSAVLYAVECAGALCAAALVLWAGKANGITRNLVPCALVKDL